MRWFLRCVSAALVVMLLGGCWSLTWQEFVAADSRFSVLMPGLPEMQVNAVMTGFGEFEQTIYTVDAGPQAYMVGFTELTEDLLVSYSADEILEDAVGRGVAAVGGEVLDFAPTEVAGYPARDLRLSVAEGDGVIDARFILADTRLYQLSAIVATKISDDAVNQRFLDSFTLLE